MIQVLFVSHSVDSSERPHTWACGTTVWLSCRCCATEDGAAGRAVPCRRVLLRVAQGDWCVRHTRAHPPHMLRHHARAAVVLATGAAVVVAVAAFAAVVVVLTAVVALVAATPPSQ